MHPTALRTSTGRLERVLSAWTFAPVPIWVLDLKGRIRVPRVALVIDTLARVVAQHGWLRHLTSEKARS